MKGNAEKLTVLLGVLTIALIITVVTASAWDDGRYSGRTLYGEYSFIGAGPCLIAPGGFNDKLQPSIEEVWFTSNTTWEGVYTFKPDGTGEISGLFRVVENGPAIGDIPDAALAKLGWKFKYSVARNGRITFTMLKGTYEAVWLCGPSAGGNLYAYHEADYYGTVSPDSNTIFVTWGVPLLEAVYQDKGNTIPLGVNVFCNVVQTAFRCSGHCPEPVYSSGPCP